MSFNSSISSNQLYAVLTPEGKRALAEGRFNIKYAAFSDSIIDYSLADSSNGDADILSMPIPEPSAEMANLANASFLISVSGNSYDENAVLVIAGGTPNIGTTANPIILNWNTSTNLANWTTNIVFDNGTYNVIPMIKFTTNANIIYQEINSYTIRFAIDNKSGNFSSPSSGRLLSGTVTDSATQTQLTLYFQVVSIR